MNRIRTALVVASAALATGMAVTPAVAVSPATGGALPTITATEVNDASLSLSGTAHLTPGRVRIVLQAKGAKDEEGGDLALVRFLPGYSFAGYQRDNRTYNANSGKNGPNKKAIAALDHFYNHSVTYGGVSVDTHKSGQETVDLNAGTYVAYNDGGQLPENPVSFTVAGAPRHTTAPASSATVTVTARGDRFGGATTLPANGTITFANRARGGTAQTLNLLHVKTGTTLKQIEQYFASGSQKEPSFGRPGFIGTDLLAAGRSQTLTYRVPAGEYVEASFAPSYTTGLPYVFVGMLKLVQLR